MQAPTLPPQAAAICCQTSNHKQCNHASCCKQALYHQRTSPQHLLELPPCQCLTRFPLHLTTPAVIPTTTTTACPRRLPARSAARAQPGHMICWQEMPLDCVSIIQAYNTARWSIARRLVLLIRQSAIGWFLAPTQTSPFALSPSSTRPA